MKLGLNPNEIRLEAENFRLRSELDYYKRRADDESNRFQPTHNDANTIDIDRDVETLRMMGFGGVRRDPNDPIGWHVFANVKRPGSGDEFKMNYYVTERSFRHERDMYLVLQDILERSAQSLARLLIRK